VRRARDGRDRINLDVDHLEVSRTQGRLQAIELGASITELEEHEASGCQELVV
jgi:hypothetical protein